MAKALSHTMSSIRGSVGGLTYSANQHAQILMKTRIAPVQPNTAKQTLVRGCVNQASIAWTLLTPTERSDWDNYAATVVYQGPQGSYHLTGRQIFIAGYSLQAYAFQSGAVGQTIVDDPPTLPGKLVTGAFNVVPGPNPGTGIGFGVTNLTTEAMMLLVNVSPPQNLTRMRYKGPWDDSMTVFVPLAASMSITHKITTPDPDLAYFMRIRAVTMATPARISSVEYLRAVSDTLP